MLYFFYNIIMEIWYNVLIIWLIFVQSQGIPIECQNCGCCKTGRSYKCIVGDFCKYGCLDGYCGDKCDNKCRYTNCAICKANRGYDCNKCKTGYYGYKCDKMCGSQCKTCQQWTGCTECNNGYYGDTCQHSCGYNCLECSKQSGCIGCRPGYYLKNGACINCQDTGCTCTLISQCHGCIEGYFLHKELCAKCPNYCITCVNSTKCTSCTDGWFGNTCQFRCTNNCINGNCVSTNAVCDCNAYNIGEMCDQCVAGYFGNDCKQKCSTGCSDTCSETDGSCTCKSGWTGDKCDKCDNKHYGDMCEQTCPQWCKTCKNESYCLSCHDGYFGVSCKIRCPDGCEGNRCKKEHGSCLSCRRGYFGEHCNMSCPQSCLSCKQYDVFSECKHGYSNTQKLCTCRTDICDNSVNCSSCTNTSFYLNDDECCLCHLDNCVSCAKLFDNIYCKTCKNGYYPQTHGQCKTCNSQCVENQCDSSSGRCIQGCKIGYWNQTCDTPCDPECLSCSQADGSCTQCKNNTKNGPKCRLECSTTCNNSVCGIDGSCKHGCITNTFGKQCENSCDDYCSPKNNSTLCFEDSRMCLYACQTEYRGRFCPQVIETEEEVQPLSIEALGGEIGGGVVALAVIVVVGLCLLRRRRKKLYEKETQNLSALYATVKKGSAARAGYANADTDNLHSVIIIENPDYESLPPNSSGRQRTPFLTEDNLEIDIADEDDIFAKETEKLFVENRGAYFNNAREVSKLNVSDLPQHVQNISLKELEEEFKKIPYGLMKDFKVSQTKLNMHKNRYRGIYPYDDTRVLVHGGETDYINASYIDGFRRRNAYISTLGPMAKQLGDFGQFWGMVWQQKVEKIVMLTNLVEGKNVKCEQYWPHHNQRILYGDIEVVCKVDKLYEDFIWRHFTISKNSEEISLHHLQFTSWPYKDVPDNVASLIELRQRVNALPSTFTGPVIVHCSACVGRTGTYIALDILTNEGEAEGARDIPGCVLNMRQNRPNMIQTLSQYKFLHQALVHSLTMEWSLIKRDHFHEYITMSSQQEVHKQFEKLQLNQEQKSDKELQATGRNRLLTIKNRKLADIPGDSNRPRLYLFLKPGESDYINAIYINSFKTRNRFLVAQTPLPDTVSDFITLAVQENSSCIVSMEGHLEKHGGIGLYFPCDNQRMKKGMVSVRSSTALNEIHFVKRMLHFEHERKTKTDVMIPHYEYLDWDTKFNIPKSAEHFVAFINEVEDASKSSRLNGPILLHCLNGAGKSGLLCVVSILLEKLIEVSVVNAVNHVKVRRPLAIPNKEQFYFCHECVLHSLNVTENAV